MKNTRIQKIILPLVCVFLFTLITGCGKSHIKTLKEVGDISTYNEIYVVNAEVSSNEQNEKHNALNIGIAQFTKDEIVKTLKQQNKYNLRENSKTIPNHLTVETIIDIDYGSRALRYWIGFGAGKGTVVINIKLKEPSSGNIKLEMEGRSTLAVGGFGGSMDKVIKKSIKQAVKQFVAKL